MGAVTVLPAISASVAKLTVAVKSATLVLRHEDREDIQVSVNNPEHWSVEGGTVRQTKVASGGNVVLANISGDGVSISQVTITGDTVISGSGINVGGGLGNLIGRLLGGKQKPSASVSAEVTINDVHIRIEDDEVWVNDRKQKGDPEHKREFSFGGNSMNVGGLEVEVDGDDVYIDGVKQVDADGEADGSQAEKPKRKQPDQIEIVVPKSFRGGLDFANAGQRPAKIDGWQGGDVVLSNESSGELEVTGPLSEIGRLELEVSGQGNVQLPDIESQSAVLELTSSGKVFSGAVRAKASVELKVRGQGNATLSDIGAEAVTLVQTSSGKINAGNVNANLYKHEVTGQGNGRVGDIVCQSAVIKQTSSGKVTAANVKAPKFAFKQSGMGNADFASIECQTFEGEKTSSGKLSIDKLTTNSIELTQSGMGDTKVEAGSAEGGKVTNSSMGKVTLRGNFRNIKERNSGMGKIKIES